MGGEGGLRRMSWQPACEVARAEALAAICTEVCVGSVGGVGSLMLGGDDRTPIDEWEGADDECMKV